MMLRSELVLACALLSACQPAPGKRVTLNLEALEGSVTLTFDTDRIPAGEVRRLYRLSPHSEYFMNGVVPAIETCIEAEPEYRPCGTRDVNAAYYRENAEVNLGKIRKALDELNRMDHPKVLEPAAAFLKEALALGLWMEERRLELFLTSNPAVLERNYRQLSPKSACGHVLQRIRGSETLTAQFELARLDWHNCVLQRIQRTTSQEDRVTAWKRFLTAYGIREKTAGEKY